MALTAADVEEARASCRGSVLLPGEPGFAESNGRVFNRMFAHRVPAVIFVPHGATDVAHAVRFGRARGLAVVARCGGHQSAGRSTVDGGVLVDLCRINNVFVEPARQRAHVGGGCLLRDVDRELAPYGLAVPLGAYPLTGVGGLALHGGVGLLSGQHGLSADNIVEVEVVTADGAIQIASEATNGDLFYAIRGMASYFGIVTRITFVAHPIPPVVHGGLITQPFTALAPYLDALAAHTLVDRAMGTYCFVTNGPRGLTVTTLACHTATDAGAATAQLDAFARLAPVVYGGFGPAPYWRINAAFGDLLAARRPPPTRQYWRPFVVAADKLTQPAFQAALQAAVDLTFRSPHVPTTMVIVEPWNRAVADHPHATPVCNIRGDFIVVAFVFSWLEAQPDAPALAVVAEVTDLLYTHAAMDHNYINYIGSVEAATDKVGRAINDTVRDRLREIKSTWDPAALFPVL